MKQKKEKQPRVKWKELPAEVRKKKRRKYIWITVGVAVAVIAVVSKAAAANAKYPVNTVEVTYGNVESTITTSGKVESDVTKTYYSELTGNIGNVPVKLGQAVKEGDVLLHFSQETLDIAGKEAQATALSGESSYNDTMNQNSENQAKLTEATVNLEVLNQQITDYEAFVKEQEKKLEETRNKKKASLSAWGKDLSKRQANGEDVAEEMAEYQYSLETLDINQELLDIQRTISDSQEILANLEEYKAEMKSQKSSTENSVLSSQAREAKAVAREAEKMRSDKSLAYVESVADGIKADMEGVVTQITVAEGAPVTSGAALVTVASNSQVHVAINLSKSDLAKVKEGQKADVTIAGKKYEGEVSFINHMATVNANNMAVVEAQIKITNADEDVYLGIEAKVVIYADKSENVLVVPVETVNSDKNGDFVYVVEDNIVVRKDVMTGVSSDTYIEVTDGLNENDQVMTDISLDITEGMEVMIVTDVSEEMTQAAEAQPEISVESE